MRPIAIVAANQGGESGDVTSGFARSFEEMRRRISSLPLLWRVFAANATVLWVAFAGLVLAPITVSVPVAASELVVLAAGLAALLITNLVLLRPAFAPLDELAETMRRQDPLAPGVRAAGDR